MLLNSKKLKLSKDTHKLAGSSEKSSWNENNLLENELSVPSGNMYFNFNLRVQ